MENQKNNKGVIALLIIIIIILSVLCILFATGTITFKSNNIDNKENNENITDNNNQNQEIQNNTNEINNNEIDKTTLNKLFDIIGIPSTNNPYGSSELNDYISNNDYTKNANEILRHTNIGIIEDNIDVDVNECAPRCNVYTKENADNLIKIYNLPGTINDYFTKSTKLENIYILHISTSVAAEWNGPDAGITHDVTSEYINSTDIKITDKQIIKKYNENRELQATNQTTTFIFKKDNENKFYLDNVTVK